MKASEFIKKYGWGEAKRLLITTPHRDNQVVYFDGYKVNIQEIEKYIDAYVLVNTEISYVSDNEFVLEKMKLQDRYLTMCQINFKKAYEMVQECQ